MSWLFADKATFNQDINGWDVSEVATMSGMFANNMAFNQDISGWNVSKVTDMGFLFNGASAFNQNLCAWKVENPGILDGTTDITDMFFNSGCDVKTDPTSDNVCQSCN